MRDTQLASELIQREVLVALLGRRPVGARAELSLQRATIADMGAAIAERDASILLNRVHRLGSREPKGFVSTAWCENWPIRASTQRSAC